MSEDVKPKDVSIKSGTENLPATTQSEPPQVVDGYNISDLERDAQKIPATAQTRGTIEYVDQKLVDVYKELETLATHAGNISFDLYRQDREGFFAQVREVSADLEKMQTMISAYEILLRQENPTLPLWQKTLVTILLVLRGSENETRLLQMLRGDNTNSRRQDTVVQLRELMSQTEERIREVREAVNKAEWAPIERRAREILSTNRFFGDLSKERDEKSIELKRAQQPEPLEDRETHFIRTAREKVLEHELNILNSKLKTVWQQALDRAQGELERK